MWPVNRLLTGAFEILLYPLRDLPPLVGVASLGLLASVAILLVFRSTSDQEGLKQVKAKIHAGVFEIRLFKDDLRAIVRAQIDILRHSLRYMRLSLVPMLWVIAPLGLILIQLQHHYGYAVPAVGDRAIVSVRLSEDFIEGVGVAGADLGPRMALDASAGLRVDTPILWIPALREASWRVTATAPGSHAVRIEVDEEVYTKSIDVRAADAAGPLTALSPVRPSTLIDQLIHPVEAPIPGGAPIEAIEVTYASADVSVFGLRMHWMVAFFVLTLLFAFALQRPLKVRI